jgi:hypothetical protein
MAKFTMDIKTGNRPLKNAQVTFYDEDQNIAEGNEDAGFTTEKSEVYSDYLMQTAASQPLASDDQGEVVAYIPSMSMVAIKVSRSGFGTRWHRWIDITGTDPI